MTTTARAKVSGDALAWVRAVVNAIVDGGDPPPSRATIHKRAPVLIGGPTAPGGDGGPSARGDGRTTAALNGLPESDFRAGQRIWVDAVIDELVGQGVVTETGGELAWVGDMHRDMTVTFQQKVIRVIPPQERNRAQELGGADAALRGQGHLNKVLIAEGGGISGNPRFRAGQRVALEVHPLAYEMPPMSDTELERFADDAKRHGIVTTLLLIPDHDDPLRKQTAKPGEQPLVLDKAGNPIPKYKVGDGRHRLYIASQYDLPVKLEVFDGTEQQIRERLVSLNLLRRMLNQVQIGIMLRQLLLPAEKHKAAERRREGHQQRGKRPDLPRDSVEGASVNGRDGEAEKAVLDAVGNPMSPNTLRSLAPLDSAPETREKAMNQEPGYRTAAGARRKAQEEIGEEPKPQRRRSRQSAYKTALNKLTTARTEFDPDYKLLSKPSERVATLRLIVKEAVDLIALENDAAKTDGPGV